MEYSESKIIIPVIILNCIMILFSLYLSILFLKSKRLHIYPCYNCLIISFIILFDNVLRLIRIPSDKDILQYIQAFLLTSLDKLLLAIIAFQAFIIYLGVVKTKFYYNHEKIIFFSGLLSSLLISLLIGGFYIYASNELPCYGIYYYCDSEIPSKKLIDVTFNSIYLVLNTFSISILLIYMFNKKEKADKGKIEDLDYDYHFSKILLMFIVNSLAFIDSYLIIYDKLPVPDDYIDLVYLSICLIVDFYYTFNKIIYKETIKIFCSKKSSENKNYNSVSSEDAKTETELAEVKTEI